MVLWPLAICAHNTCAWFTAHLQFLWSNRAIDLPDIDSVNIYFCSSTAQPMYVWDGITRCWSSRIDILVNWEELLLPFQLLFHGVWNIQIEIFMYEERHRVRSHLDHFSHCGELQMVLSCSELPFLILWSRCTPLLSGLSWKPIDVYSLGTTQGKLLHKSLSSWNHITKTDSFIQNL